MNTQLVESLAETIRTRSLFDPPAMAEQGKLLNYCQH
jgi:hypothetical protein